MRRSLLFVVLLAVLAIPVAANEFHDAKDKLDKAFKPDGTAEERVQAVFAVGTFDTKEAAKVLVDAVGWTEKLLEPKLSRKDDVDAQLRKLLDAQMLANPRTLSSSDMAKMNALKQESAGLQVGIDGDIKVLTSIRDGLSRFTDKSAIEWLGRSALEGAKPWKAREIVAKVLTKIGTPVAGGYLLRGLRDRDDRVRVAAALGVGKLKVPDSLQKLLELLRAKAWTVRSAAIQALGDLGEKGAVGPLIDQIEKEEGRLREDCAQALTKLTGQKFGQVPESWRRWWEAHKDEYGGEHGKPLGGHPPDDSGDPGTGYYGLPVNTSRAIFILDVSGSMSMSSKNPGAPPKAGDLSKIAVAKRELKRVIDQFDPKGKFDVIIFNDTVKAWKPGMMPATKAMKADAQKFVAGLSAASSTNIYDALELAFKIAGMGARDKYYELGADTIFLLSDGSPTKPDGSPDDWQKIIRACRQWNSLKRVKINTIGVGGANVAFMSTLASENGGKYVAR